MMNCVVCGKEVPHKLASQGGMNPWCSNPCQVIWQQRNRFQDDLRKNNNFLFLGAGHNALKLIVAKGYLDDDVPALTLVNQVSKEVRPLAKEHELGNAFVKPAVHMQQRGMRTETSTEVKTKQVPTGKKITVEKTSVKGNVFKRTVPEMKTVSETITKTWSVPNIECINIGQDQTFEIALMAYNTAVQLKQLRKPVILYRVNSKGTLTKDEKNTQTLSSSVHASVGTDEVWPIEKTAAWIQGAMRARVSFVLLNDPRAKDMLIGGVDKKSDAIYVRELHQITCMKYQIKEATGTDVPQNLRGKTRPFILTPPEHDLGVLPLVPKISSDIWSHTWNSSKSNLALNETPQLIRDHLLKLFTEAGESLKMPVY